MKVLFGVQIETKLKQYLFTLLDLVEGNYKVDFNNLQCNRAEASER